MDNSTDPIRLHIETPKIEPIRPGGGGWDFQGINNESTAWFWGAFNNAELDAIIRIGNSLQTNEATISGNRLDKQYRDSQTSWLYPNEVTGWIFERLTAVILQTNAQFFRFDLTGLYQGLQFTKYEAPSQHYTWHQDSGPNCGIRKLSLSLQLSDPDDYEGGELEFMLGADPGRFEKRRGLIGFFPSWTLHRVTPVTKGTRYSLVAWVSGPPFK